MRNYVRPRSNIKVHFQDPLESEILINDIFYQLARLPRFNASTSRIYTVGQHSLAVADQMPGNIALIGLLHDAAEYVFNDVASPIVAVCPDYKKMRDNFQNVIYCKFLPNALYKELDQHMDLLHQIDKDWCSTEMFRLKGKDLEPSDTMIKEPLLISSPEETELLLHRAFNHYMELAYHA